MRGLPARKGLRQLNGRRLHTRAMVADGRRAFIGSQSLKALELDKRREVGLIINNHHVARKILSVFESDWADSAKGSKDIKPKEKAKRAA